jgi:protoheme IX farnesyltransferase
MQTSPTWQSPTPHHDSFWQVCRSYWQLTKPRIIPLLLIETAASMLVAAQGTVDPLLLIVTLLTGALAAASAQSINCIYDRDIDFDMERTRHRPIPSGRIQLRDALIFAVVLAATAFALQALVANVLSAALEMVGIAVYVGVYTHWLKRSSTQNIVIGGAAGAIPPLVGWAAVTGELSWAAWLFFAIVFIWTPPHFWALALVIQDDYAKVGVPMLPVVVGDEATAKQIWAYTLVLVPITLADDGAAARHRLGLRRDRPLPRLGLSPQSLGFVAVSQRSRPGQVPVQIFHSLHDGAVGRHGCG